MKQCSAIEPCCQLQGNFEGRSFDAKHLTAEGSIRTHVQDVSLHHHPYSLPLTSGLESLIPALQEPHLFYG